MSSLSRFIINFVWIAVWMVAAATVFWILSLENEPRHKVVEAAQVAKNMEVIKACIADLSSCRGGYIKMVGQPVLRIEDCPRNCGNLEISLDAIRFNPGLVADRAEYIVLPLATGTGCPLTMVHNDPWQRAAIEYAAQLTNCKKP